MHHLCHGKSIFPGGFWYVQLSPKSFVTTQIFSFYSTSRNWCYPCCFGKNAKCAWSKISLDTSDNLIACIRERIEKCIKLKGSKELFLAISHQFVDHLNKIASISWYTARVWSWRLIDFFDHSSTKTDKKWHTRDNNWMFECHVEKWSNRDDQIIHDRAQTVPEKIAKFWCLNHSQSPNIKNFAIDPWDILSSWDQECRGSSDTFLSSCSHLIVVNVLTKPFSLGRSAFIHCTSCLPCCTASRARRRWRNSAKKNVKRSLRVSAPWAL